MRGWERFKGGTRLEFVCGGRTLTAFRELRDTVTAASRLLSVLPHELSTAIGRLQEEARDLRRSQRDLQAELAGFRAGALAASAETIGAQRAVLASVPGADGNALKALAVAIVAQPGLAVVLVSDARPAIAVVARSSDVALDASTLFRTLAGRFGGKGGGRPDLAQGGGLDAPADAILDAARAALAGGIAPPASGCRRPQSRSLATSAVRARSVTASIVTPRALKLLATMAKARRSPAIVVT